MNLKRFPLFCCAAAGMALLSIPTAFSDPAAAGFYLHDGDRVVMYGDSITDQKLYTVDTETYVTTRFPNLKVDWTAAGWGGDRVGGGGGGPIDVRLNRDVLPYKPTVVTIMLAMNDAGYKAFDQSLYNIFTTGYQHIIDTISKADPGVRFTLIEPSPYDEITRPQRFAGGYNSVLIKYGQFLTTIKVPGTPPVDFNTPVNDMLTKADAANHTLAQTIVPDQVHPSPAGHLIMTEALLKGWNAPALVSSVDIDTSSKSVTTAQNTKVTGLKVGATTEWDELDNSLPMPYDTTDKATALVLASSDFIQAVDQEPLVVKGLAAGSYDLKIDGAEVGKFTGDQLAAGINLATVPTPMFDQAQTVRKLVADKQNWHSEIYHGIEPPYWSSTDPDIKKSLDASVQALLLTEQKIAEKAKAAAIPTSHHFVIAPLQ